MLEHTRMCMYWPGITDAIKDSILASGLVDANFKHAPPNPVKITNVKCTGNANLTEKGVKASNTNDVYKTCSGHVSKPVTRSITQM